MTVARQVIKEQGRTVAWVARRLGIDRTYLSRMLSGERPMPRDVMERLAGILQVPVGLIDEEEGVPA